MPVITDTIAPSLVALRRRRLKEQSSGPAWCASELSSDQRRGNAFVVVDDDSDAKMSWMKPCRVLFFTWSGDAVSNPGGGARPSGGISGSSGFVKFAWARLMGSQENHVYALTFGRQEARMLVSRRTTPVVFVGAILLNYPSLFKMNQESARSAGVGDWSLDRRHQARRMNALRAGLVLCWLAAPAIVGCAHARSSGAVGNLFDAQRQVEQYIASGRYEADVAKVAREAQAYVERRATRATRPAIVLDIDETSLSNWPAYRVNGWGRVVGGECDLDQGPCGIRAWQALGQSKALAPTLELVTRAKALGVAVFFISARPHALLEATERNLRDQGYVWDGVTVLPEGASFASAVDFKAPERKRIAERGFTILVSMGDQYSDLKGGYAERTFKL